VPASDNATVDQGNRAHGDVVMVESEGRFFEGDGHRLVVIHRRTVPIAPPRPPRPGERRLA
jgi:hypothetical protein